MWPDAVVDVAEAGGLHRERAAVVDRGAVEVLAFEGAEEAFDDAVGLRAPDAGADVARQRIVASEGRLVGLTTEAGAVVGDDGDPCRNHVDDLAGVLVDQFEFATVVPQVVQAENAFGLVDGRVETGERVRAAAGRGDPGGEAVLGGVVDDRADAPDPAAVVSNSLKSVCQTRLRSVGGSSKTLRRSAAQDLRSARNPRGSKSPRRRRARSTVEVDTSRPSARIIAAILR